MTNQYVTDRNQTWVQLVSYSTFMTLLPTKNQGGVAKSYLVFNVTYRALNQGGETGNKTPQFIHSNCSLASNTLSTELSSRGRSIKIKEKEGDHSF